MKDPLPIVDSWRQYFADHDEGLGSTYERFVLNAYFRRFKKRFAVARVLEAPVFGMTGVSGINSMWWAANGADVTLVDDNEERVGLIRRVWGACSLKASVIARGLKGEPLPFSDRNFDLAWNFASIWFVQDLRSFLGELARVSTKAVFICVPNLDNVFNAKRVAGLKHDPRIYLDNIDPGRIKQCLSDMGWQADEEGFLDCPPWPDIAMKKEDFLKRLGCSFLVKKKQNNDRGLSILDYFNGSNKEMEKQVLKHGWLENAPGFLKKHWAHHRYLLFVPEGSKL